jgi:hypothetical protein
VEEEIKIIDFLKKGESVAETKSTFTTFDGGGIPIFNSKIKYKVIYKNNLHLIKIFPIDKRDFKKFNYFLSKNEFCTLEIKIIHEKIELKCRLYSMGSDSFEIMIKTL